MIGTVASSRRSVKRVRSDGCGGAARLGDSGRAVQGCPFPDSWRLRAVRPGCHRAVARGRERSDLDTPAGGATIWLVREGAVCRLVALVCGGWL